MELVVLASQARLSLTQFQSGPVNPQDPERPEQSVEPPLTLCSPPRRRTPASAFLWTRQDPSAKHPSAKHPSHDMEGAQDSRIAQVGIAKPRSNPNLCSRRLDSKAFPPSESIGPNS